MNTSSALFTLVLAALACSDNSAFQERTPIAPDISSDISAATIAQGDRKDTPWQRMSDSEFRSAVSARGGRVIIGLKEPGMTEGVDNTGRTLTTLARVRSGIESLRSAGADILFEFDGSPVIVARMTPELAVALRQNPWVDYVEPDGVMNVHSQVVPWGITKIKAPESWTLSTGSGVKLLIIDTGVSHSDISVSVSFRCESGDYADQAGHGTHVAGIAAAANNSSDVVGAAYGVSLWSADASVDEYTSNLYNSEIACSIQVGRNNAVDVVNMSFGGPDNSTAITDQINGGYNYQDMVFVAATGNDSSATVNFPARLSNVIAVGAIDSTNARAPFSQTGSEIDFVAPGVSVLSTSVVGGFSCASGGNTTLCDGTSMATPHVSAASAMLRARYPAWSNADIKNRLVATAQDLGASGFDNSFGNGLINVSKALGMTTYVSGPSYAYSGTSESWTAVVSGGQTPYTYQWTINGSTVGTGSTLNQSVGYSNFWLKLQVTETYSLVAKDSVYVTVVTCTPPVIC